MSLVVYTPDSNRIVHTTFADMSARQINRPVHLVQYDSSLPILKVNLYKDGNPYTIPSGSDANIRLKKADGTFVYNPVLGTDSGMNAVYVEVSEQMCTASGEANFVVEITNNLTNVASSSTVPIQIDKNPVSSSDITSTSEAKSLIEYVTEAQAAATQAAASSNSAQQHANASSASANAATLAETNAKTSETNAKASETKAKTSETNAKTSETNAKTSETNASNSATLSESWAVGGTGTRTGENTDNSKYYSQQSKTEADRAKTEADRAASIVGIGVATTTTAGIVKPDGSSITVDADGTIHSLGGGGSLTGYMKKSDYVDAGGTGQVLSAKNADNAANATKATKVGNATTSVLEDLSDNGGQLQYKGNPIGGSVTTDGTTITTNTSGQLTLASDVTTKLPQTAPTIANAGQVPTVQSNGTVDWGNGGHEMYDSTNQIPKDSNGFVNVTKTDEHVLNAYAITEIANKKTYRIIVDAKVEEENGTGIGHWCEDIDNYSASDSTTWLGGRSLTDHPEDAEISKLLKAVDEDIEISFLYEVDNNEPIYCGGYQLDTTLGRLCIKYGNVITKDGRIAIDVTRLTDIK